MTITGNQCYPKAIRKRKRMKKEIESFIDWGVDNVLWPFLFVLVLIAMIMGVLLGIAGIITIISLFTEML